jgi:hypothetical protein
MAMKIAHDFFIDYFRSTKTNMHAVVQKNFHSTYYLLLQHKCMGAGRKN